MVSADESCFRPLGAEGPSLARRRLRGARIRRRHAHGGRRGGGGRLHGRANRKIADLSDRPVLVVASGANRVDEKRIAAEIGERIVRADADFVRDATGFAIGGVPPVGHKTPPVTLIDDDLFQHQTIWAAAGTPNAVFRLTPERLAELTGGRRSRIGLPSPLPGEGVIAKQ
jgi:hypothetical protein